MFDAHSAVDVRFLQDVGRRDAPGEPVIEPQLYHAAELLPVLVDNSASAGAIPGRQAQGNERGNLGIGFSGIAILWPQF